MNPAALQAAIAAWQHAKKLHESGMLKESEPYYRKALAVLSGSADLLVDYGRLAEQLGDWRAAEKIWRAASQAAPQRLFGDHLGLALSQQGRFDDACAVLEEHHRKAPNDTDSMVNLAFCLVQVGRDDDALRTLRKLVRTNPRHRQGWQSLVTLLINMTDREGTEAALEKALATFPDDPELRYALMEHRLKSGDFAGGFDLFGARWGTRFVGTAVRLPTERLWDGQPFAGRLLVRAEQGIGDELLYSSIFGDLARAHPDTVIDCDARLGPLLSRSLPDITFIPRDTPDDDPRKRDFDRQCLAGDLPRWFRRRAADFPARDHWLQADPARVAALRDRYRTLFGDALRVGIAWRSIHPAHGSAKTLDLDRLQPLLTVPGVQFVNLQYGDTTAEIEAFRARTGHAPWRDPEIDATRDLDALAAQVSALDLVISTSNSTVHLAGALGTETWVLLHRDRGLPWYWGYEGTRVPWYRSVELLRCARRGEWEPVIAQAASRLARRAQPGL